MKECLDAIKTIQMAVLAICAALLIMGSSPILSQQYETALNGVSRIPELPRNDHFRGVVLNAIDGISKRKAQEIDTWRKQASASNDRLIDRGGRVADIWFSMGMPNIPFPDSDRLDALTKFLDYVSATARPVPAAIPLIGKLKTALPSACTPCETVDVTVLSTTRKESFDVELRLKEPRGPIVQVVLKDVLGSSDLQAPIEGLLTMLVTGDSDMHENDYRSTKPWWDYLSTQLQADLSPVWQEIRFMSRREALKEVSDRAQRAKMTISLFGIPIDEQLAAVAAPASLLLVVLYLYFHILHLASLDEADWKLFSQYPWAPLFLGATGELSTLMMLFGLPTASVVVFCVRVWKSSLLVADHSLVRGWESSLISAGAIAAAMALTLKLRRIKEVCRMKQFSPGGIQR